MEPTGGHQAPSDKDAITSGPRGQGQNVLATVNRYDDEDLGWHGALIEETAAFRADLEVFHDLHTLVWDAATEQTLDVRNDARGSTVSYASSTVPEIELTNDFAFADGSTATLTQSLVTGTDRCGLLVDNGATFSAAHDRTLYTVVNLGIKGHDHEDPEATQDAYHLTYEGADLVVAHWGDRYVVLAQEALDGAGDARRFDGHRLGMKGVSTGPDRSAWADIYQENDGWIDANEREVGNLDAGIGLSVGDRTDVRWRTALGFGKREQGAIDNALGLLEAGYEATRERFADAWAAWHAGVADGPTDDARANELYELSLTSMKCAQDPSGGVIAGAFKPGGMTYRFIWPRDLVIVVQALAAAGAEADVRRALDWFRDHQITGDVVDDRGIQRRGTWWQNYFATGEPHWRALQLDQVGGPIYAHWLAWREFGDEAEGADGWLDPYYDTSRRAAEFLLEHDNGWGFPEKHQDPWEETWGHSTEGTAAAIAGLRCMAALAAARGDDEFAADCRDRAATWASNVDAYCLKETAIGRAYVTADSPEPTGADPAPDDRPDAAAFMAVWPWNVIDADHEPMRATSALVDHPDWRADESLVVGRYPGDRYTPSGQPEDGGWPLCEAYADVVAWQNGVRADAVSLHLFDHVDDWTTAAGLLPERVDDIGDVRWNSNLQWSQAMYVLLAESHVRGEPYGLAPGG
jgi:GH15 family glucan-1,4-alpha-glucosidase